MSTTKVAAPEIVPAYRCWISHRGPNWLFVRVEAEGICCGLGERLWRLAEQQFTYRMVLDFGPSAPADPKLACELRSLCCRLKEKDGDLQLCGLDPEVATFVLEETHCPSLHNHSSEYDAVWHGPISESGTHTALKQPR